MKIEDLAYEVGDEVRFRDGENKTTTRRHSPLIVTRIKYSKTCNSGIAVCIRGVKHPWDSNWFRKVYVDNFEEIWPPQKEELHEVG